VEKVLTFNGTGAALTGEEVLQKEGLEVRVMARPNVLGGQCGFCLRVNPADLARAVGLLTAAHVAVLQVYDQKPGSRGLWIYEEVPRDRWEIFPEPIET
jgi:hypothetical protein